ncbi:alpha/beta hydrolase [Mesorhizobium sp. 1M-11]|uniref:alpha/beta hydrolase n=1 Tax=Mesorhizobium sp. 1M-11 TaxID=1529006 RepID=UPI0006C74AB1|nr:alpha/beta hydrolase [Mesorhizobium sp. 1M-11]
MERLEFRLLGFPEFRMNGRRVSLALRKAAALLIFLAEAGGSVSRETAATLLWPEADEETARARLRRTLYKIRVAFRGELVAASGTTLNLQPALSVEVDTRAFEHACDRGSLETAVNTYTGDFLAGFALEGCQEFEEWAFFRREALRSRLTQALERLIETRIAAGDARTAIVHATRLVGLDPLSESAHRHLIRAHLAAGDRAAAERQLEACARHLRDELGVPLDPATVALLQGPGKATEAPRTRYVEVEGIHLAYQTVGDGPLDIVLVPGFVSHVERIWEDSRCRSWIAAVSRIGRLILFDRRGVGLSDRVGARPTVDATAKDILAVMDAAGSRRALLVGSSEGGPGCIRFAVDHPDRLVGLVLWGSLAKGSRTRDYTCALTHEQYDLWRRRLIANWGGPAEIETFAPSLVGDRQAEAWWAGLLRAASSPGAVTGVLEALRDTDVRHLLARISVPTTVLHRSGDRAVLAESGRFLAAKIPGGRFVEVAGDDHWFWVGDQTPLLRAIGEFAGRYR